MLIIRSCQRVGKSSGNSQEKQEKQIAQRAPDGVIKKKKIVLPILQIRIVVVQKARVLHSKSDLGCSLQQMFE